MDIHGRALLDYFNGEKDTFYLLHRDDGFTYPSIYIKQFFYDNDEFPELDKIALNYCRGKILDIGAGAGSHSLYLQKRGLDVVSTDISPLAVEVMKRRGIGEAMVADLYHNFKEKFDTILIISGIGIVGDINGLEEFLIYLPSILKQDGVLLTDSFDLSSQAEEVHKQYQLKKTSAGKYFGERVIRIEYKGQMSNWFEWMHIDPESLTNYVAKAGYKIEILGWSGSRYLCSIKINR